MHSRHAARPRWPWLLPLLLTATLLSVPTARATTYYIAPAGSDSASGTAPGSPWKTFATAVGKLRPGDTLVLRDGTYTAANCGSGGCGQGVLNLSTVQGTARQPITVKAEHERQAYIAEDGTYTGINVSGTGYVVLEGLRVSTEARGRQSEPVYGRGAHHLTVRKLLVHNSDNRANAHLIDLQEGHHLLVEDTELYTFHRHALVFGAVTDSVVRRVYCHSRPPQPMHYPVPAGSSDNDAGDACVAIYPGSSNLLENVIAEANGHLTEINGVVGSNNSDNTVLGSITLQTGATVTPNARGYAVADMVRGVRIADTVAVGLTRRMGYHGDAPSSGLDFIGCLGCTVTNVTIVDGDGHGVQATDSAEWVAQYASPPSLTISNTLVTRMGGTAFRNIATPQFSVDHAAVFQTGDDGQGLGSFTAIRTDDPKLGGCLVWIPATSPLKRAGAGGQDIGANILYRYQDGTLTTTPLWDPRTGQFAGCGATVAGVNDNAALSCSGVHQRLHVNTQECAFPKGYGGGTASLPPPTKLRIVPNPTGTRH